MLTLYSIFHLNPAYSAIEIEDRQKILDSCYWPLLRLVRKAEWPIGLEISAWGLEELSQLDPLWVEELRKLIDESLIDLVGSGYCQIIGPLVPHQVNRQNFEIGWQIYDQLLGARPKLALVNEQAFSSGVAELLLDVGVSTLMMEWNNPRLSHPEWKKTLLYEPNRLKLPSGRSISILWNESVTFQKFQRFAHGELEQEEMVQWLTSHNDPSKSRNLPLYGNDAEVFDFRPGRYMTEEPIDPNGEWNRIESLIDELKKSQHFAVQAPSEIVKSPTNGHFELITLQSPQQPIPVKKQPKYNIVRWAVTGRDDYTLNSQCHEILSGFIRSGKKPDLSDWCTLLELWSSDYRTHIGEQRWTALQRRLRRLQKKWAAPNIEATESAASQRQTDVFHIERKGRFLLIRGNRIKCVFNLRRGLALQSWIDTEVSPAAMIGTIPTGAFEGIHMAADFYTGHLIFHPPGMVQMTDLAPVALNTRQAGESLVIKAEIKTDLGVISKEVRIDDSDGVLGVRHSVPVHNKIGSLRFGHATILPGLLNPENIVFESHLGGMDSEIFSLANGLVDHGSAVSNLISASQGVGATNGWMELHDGERGLHLALHDDSRGALGLVKSQTWKGERLDRLCFTAMEVDDTSHPYQRSALKVGVDISVFKFPRLSKQRPRVS